MLRRSQIAATDRYTLWTMGLPADVTRVALQGVIGTSEIFETGFWMRGLIVPDNAAANTFCEALSTALLAQTSAMTKVKSIMNNVTRFTKIRSYTYASGFPATAIGEADFAASGTGSTPSPWQMSIVATLRTGLAGRQNRGRMYFPATGIGVGTNGYLSGGIDVDLAPAVAQLLDAANDVETLASVVVVSQTATAAHPVTAVSVDNKPDIQRRRANKLIATSTTSADLSP